MASPVRSAPRATAVLRNVGHGANDLYWYVLPPVLPLILAEFGLQYAAAGGIIALFLTMIAVASMLTGRLSDRMHRGRLIGLGFLLASAAIGAAAFMPLLPLVIGFLVLAGIGVSVYHPTAYAAIHDAGHGTGRTYGEFEAAGSLSVILMLVVQGLLAGRAGWRGLILVGAVPGALLGLILLAVPRISIWDHRAPAHVAPILGPGRHVSPRKGTLLPALFLAGVMLRVLGVNALTNFIPTYLVRAVGMDHVVSTFAVGFVFVGGILGAMVMGRVADRRGPYPVFLLATGLLIPLLPLLGVRMPTVLYPVVLVLIGFFNSSCFPTQNMILAALSGDRAKGSVFGAMMAASALTAAVSPLAFGLIADAAGLRAAVYACAAPALVGWVFFLVVRMKLAAR
jgi:MFS transporter, FSR family, fosmidomycin resistance protein